MQHIIDLHIHSHYSRATSKNMDIEGLYYWSKIKGIHVIGTGDFTHPLWLEELQKKLELDDNGLYNLRPDIKKRIDSKLPPSCRLNPLQFIPTVEISNIYSKNGKVRKLHNIIIVPTLSIAAKLNSELEKIGNLHADGRPILGMDSKRLLELTIQSHPDSLFIPAHIWTPWFAMFGSKSGFDSIKEAFEELSDYIYAVETGLSSDPFMNWRLSQLDNRTLVSNSDAHSAQKLGREATIIKAELSYKNIINAIKTNDKRLVGTIEFFPQEGKYHYDGHRTCNIRFRPEQTLKHKGICPKCKKPLVVGVQNRVHSLADRPSDYKPQSHKQVEYIIPLVEIIAQARGVKGIMSATVQKEYARLFKKLGDEFSILRLVPIKEIEKISPETAAGIKKMRSHDVIIDPGYDGVFGIIRVFDKKGAALQKQIDLGI